MTVIYPHRLRVACGWFTLCVGCLLLGFFGANTLLYHGQVTDIVLASFGGLNWAIGANCLYRASDAE